jgi:hypothetical protein
VLHHQRKAAGDDFVDTVSGTLGLAGAADTILTLENQGDAPIENDLSPERQKILDALAAVRRVMRAEELGRAIGIKPKNVRNLLWQLDQEGLVRRQATALYELVPAQTELDLGAASEEV